jgi:hypothetical protein
VPIVVLLVGADAMDKAGGRGAICGVAPLPRVGVLIESTVWPGAVRAAARPLLFRVAKSSK